MQNILAFALLLCAFRFTFYFFSMATYKLSASLRDTKHTRARLAKEGLIPGVVYGPGVEPMAVALPLLEFSKVFHTAGTSQVIVLNLDKQSNPTLVHEVQKNPVNGAIIHVDFYHITKGHKVTAQIPLTFSGVSMGVKDLGGTLVTHIRDIEVQGLPENLPASLDIDVSALKEFGDEITLGDIAFPQDVSPLAQADVIIVSLLAPGAKEPEPVPSESQTQEDQTTKEGQTPSEPPQSNK